MAKKKQPNPMPVCNTVRAEVLSWIVAYDLGLKGVLPAGAIAPAPEARDPAQDVAPPNQTGGERTRLKTRAVLTACTVPSARIIGIVEEDEWVPACTSPPDSAYPWLGLGNWILEWREACSEEAQRCVQAFGKANKLPPGDKVDLAEATKYAGFKPPSLKRIVEMCQHVCSCNDPRLYTAKFMATRLVGLSDSAQWSKLWELGYALTQKSDYGGSLQCIMTIERFLMRDLMFMASGKPPHPRWHPDRGELTFNDAVIKRFPGGRAKNVIPILKEFEDQGWPTTVTAPGRWKSKLHDTLKRLNKTGQDTVRFHACDDGTRVRWDINL